jgi:hypothetical protein
MNRRLAAKLHCVCSQAEYPKVVTSFTSVCRLHSGWIDFLTLCEEIEIEKILEMNSPYIHKDYDGDPAIALGSAAVLMETGISGVANILPFTCMPYNNMRRIERL